MTFTYMAGGIRKWPTILAILLLEIHPRNSGYALKYTSKNSDHAKVCTVQYQKKIFTLHKVEAHFQMVQT